MILSVPDFAFTGGQIGLLALTLCSAFMSIQYPTIFSLGIKNLGQDTKYGSSSSS